MKGSDNVNRQQKRASLRDKEKRINKGLVNLKKNAKSKAEIENYNVAKWAMELSEKEKAYMNKLMIDSSKVDMMCFEKAWNIVLSANYSKETVEELTSLVIEEGLKFNEYMEDGGDYLMAIKNNAEAILRDYKKGKEKNIKESELIKDLSVNYKITVSAIKKLIKEEQTKEALAYIFNSNEKPKETQKTMNKVTPAANNKYKILKEEIKRDIQGEFGVYHVDSKKVEIEGITFNSKEDVEKATRDRLAEIQEQLNELEKQKDNANKSKEEVLEIMKLYM